MEGSIQPNLHPTTMLMTPSLLSGAMLFMTCSYQFSYGCRPYLSQVLFCMNSLLLMNSLPGMPLMSKHVLHQVVSKQNKACHSSQTSTWCACRLPGLLLLGHRLNHLKSCQHYKSYACSVRRLLYITYWIQTHSSH